MFSKFKCGCRCRREHNSVNSRKCIRKVIPDEAAAQSGIIIHTVGVGTVAGSLIPVFSERGDRIDYKKDRKGKLVTSILNEPMLNELAMLGGGVFVRFDNRGGSMDDVLEIDRLIQSYLISIDRGEDRYITPESGENDESESKRTDRQHYQSFSLFLDLA